GGVEREPPGEHRQGGERAAGVVGQQIHAPLDGAAQRATAVRGSFRLTAENLPAVVGICRALEGMPLAIELAAARIRALSPQQVLERLDSALDLLVSGARDLPERQRALSRTIEWSVDLLPDDARRAFAALSVFAGRFTLDSAEEVLRAAHVDDPLASVEALVEASLLHSTDQPGAPTFRYLSTVRAYGAELLTGAERDDVVDAWIAHHRSRAQRAGAELRGRRQREWLTRLEFELEDLARVERELIDRRRLDDAADFAWSLYLFLWIAGHLGVVREWMGELTDLASRESVPISPRTSAIALYYVNAIRFWEDLAYDPLPGLTRGRDLFDESGDTFGAALTGVSIGLGLLARPGDGPDFPAASNEVARSLDGFTKISDTWGMAMALVTLGRIEMAMGHPDSALARFERSLELARSQGELLGIVISQNHRGWARFFTGDLEGAREDFAEGLERSHTLGHDEGVAYGLEGFVGLAARAGDAHTAGLLVGAAEALRMRKGILNPGAFEFHTLVLGGLREAGSGDELDRAAAEGRSLTVDQALAHVRD
ncbi:MAG: tetratricopeptide repeat protein, partial [Microbacterium sp.]